MRKRRGNKQWKSQYPKNGPGRGSVVLMTYEILYSSVKRRGLLWNPKLENPRVLGPNQAVCVWSSAANFWDSVLPNCLQVFDPPQIQVCMAVIDPQSKQFWAGAYEWVLASDLITNGETHVELGDIGGYRTYEFDRSRPGLLNELCVQAGHTPYSGYPFPVTEFDKLMGTCDTRSRNLVSYVPVFYTRARENAPKERMWVPGAGVLELSPILLPFIMEDMRSFFSNAISREDPFRCMERYASSVDKYLKRNGVSELFLGYPAEPGKPILEEEVEPKERVTKFGRRCLLEMPYKGDKSVKIVHREPKLALSFATGVSESVTPLYFS